MSYGLRMVDSDWPRKRRQPPEAFISHMGEVLRDCNDSRRADRHPMQGKQDRRAIRLGRAERREVAGRQAFLKGLTSLIAHSPPDSRQAVPCRDEDEPWPITVARKARQISSLFTK